MNRTLKLTPEQIAVLKKLSKAYTEACYNA